MIPYNGIYMGVDPKGRGKDALGYTVIAHSNGKLYLLEASSIKGVGYSTESLVKLSQVAKEYGVNKIYVEENFGDGMFSTLWKPILATIYPCTIEEIKHSIQKEARIIDTLEPVMNQHRLIVDKGVVERDVKSYLSGVDNQPFSLFFQMSHITRDRGSLIHDDILDVVAMVVAQWMRVLVQHPDEALDRYKKHQMDKFREGMIAKYKGSKSSNRLFGSNLKRR